MRIRLSKDVSIYGKFSGSLKKPLFIVIHGLLGNMDEEFYGSAVQWFGKRGFSTFRFNLYGPQRGARQLTDCTLKVHSSDLDKVVGYFKKKGVKKIFVAGHSFGGLTILLSRKQDFDGAVLWDPSYKTSFTKKVYGFPGGKYIKEIKGYLMRWGINVVIGKAMAEEVDSLRWNSIAKNFKVPFKLVLAGNGELKGAKSYISSAKVKTELATIKGATHYFNDKKGLQENVFRSSLKWFKLLDDNV